MTTQQRIDARLNKAREVLNAANCPPAQLTLMAAAFAPYLYVDDTGAVYAANDDGTRRTTDDLLGTGVPLPYPLDRYFRECQQADWNLCWNLSWGGATPAGKPRAPKQWVIA